MAGNVKDGSDEHRVRALVEAYAFAADRRDAEWFTSLWLPEATLQVFDGEHQVTGTYEGAEAMSGVTVALSRYLRTVHLVSTHHCRFDGDDAATGQTYCTAHHLVAHAGEGEAACEDHVMTIRYDDVYGRDEAGGWRFARRECHKLWVRTEPVTSFDDLGSTGAP